MSVKRLSSRFVLLVLSIRFCSASADYFPVGIGAVSVSFPHRCLSVHPAPLPHLLLSLVCNEIRSERLCPRLYFRHLEDVLMRSLILLYYKYFSLPGKYFLIALAAVCRVTNSSSNNNFIRVTPSEAAHE